VHAPAFAPAEQARRGIRSPGGRGHRLRTRPAGAGGHRPHALGRPPTVRRRHREVADGGQCEDRLARPRDLVLADRRAGRALPRTGRLAARRIRRSHRGGIRGRRRARRASHFWRWNEHAGGWCSDYADGRRCRRLVVETLDAFAVALGSPARSCRLGEGLVLGRHDGPAGGTECALRPDHRAPMPRGSNAMSPPSSRPARSRTGVARLEWRTVRRRPIRCGPADAACGS
jgi:hypothetical protein